MSGAKDATRAIDIAWGVGADEATHGAVVASADRPGREGPLERPAVVADETSRIEKGNVCSSNDALGKRVCNGALIGAGETTDIGVVFAAAICRQASGASDGAECKRLGNRAAVETDEAAAGAVRT